MNKPSYTASEMQNRFIACSLLLDPPALGAVIHASGKNAGMPVLYDSIEAARDEMFFDDQVDKIIPACEYYERIKAGNFKF